MKNIELLTPKALAKRLGVTYDYMRQILVRVRKGELDDWKGYRFFGEPNKSWYAYDGKININIIDEGDE